ncbi:MAG: hypothetical protein C0514_06805 [Candidatus Puniceispirillum sp.]|nr:hypothetical protein [Candidatus Puniceispirillum sp.]
MSDLRALTRTRSMLRISCTHFLDKKMKPCLRLALLSLFTSATLLASFEESSQPAPRTHTAARPVDLEALRQCAQITWDQALFAQDPHIKCALYGANAQTWEVILREIHAPREEEAIIPGLHYGHAVHFARSALDKIFYSAKANTFWEDYLKRVPNPMHDVLRRAAWSAHEMALVTENPTQKAALMARCVELWERYINAPGQTVLGAPLQQAARSFYRALFFAQTPARKAYLALQSARAWDRYFNQQLRPDDEKTFEDAAKAYDAVVSFAQDSVIRDTYRQKGSLMGVVFPKNS